MTVIPNTLKSGNTHKAMLTAQTTNQSPSFKSNETKNDSFEKRPKDSWAHKYRDSIGALGGVVAGEVLWHSLLRKKAEGMKNMTGLKLFGLNFAIDGILAVIGGKIALQVGKND